VKIEHGYSTLNCMIYYVIVHVKNLFLSNNTLTSFQFRWKRTDLKQACLGSPGQPGQYFFLFLAGRWLLFFDPNFIATLSYLENEKKYALY